MPLEEYLQPRQATKTWNKRRKITNFHLALDPKLNSTELLEQLQPLNPCSTNLIQISMTKIFKKLQLQLGNPFWAKKIYLQEKSDFAIWL